PHQPTWRLSPHGSKCIRPSSALLAGKETLSECMRRPSARPHDPEPRAAVRPVDWVASRRSRLGKPRRVALTPGTGARARVARRAGSATSGGQIPKKRPPWVGNGGPDTEP